MITTSAAAIQEGLIRAHWSAVDLWRAALGMGGSFSREDIDEILSGRHEASPSEHDVLASALNDHFVDQGQDHPVRYWRELQPLELADGNHEANHNGNHNGNGSS